MNQKGFTLIELLVALAVGGVLLIGLVLSIQQLLVGTDRTNSQVVAVTDASNAANRIREDLLMAQSTDLTDGNPVPQSSVTLAWTDQTRFGSSNPTSHDSSYVLSGTNLRRTYDGTLSIVGRTITSLGFTQNGRVINVVITATGSGIAKKSETLRFSVHMRPEIIE
ncbi:MAG: prepilin-type N-terminal cleavage/methylation domain-containing protein [Chloroflexi bacterium]|nr:prepilin-type N-terminal cleavage/methylation domain-containing protein [Chloroflexota bacterium]